MAGVWCAVSLLYPERAKGQGEERRRKPSALNIHRKPKRTVLSRLALDTGGHWIMLFKRKE